jgi:hypothetical protein
MRVFNVLSVATFAHLWLLYSSSVVASVDHQHPLNDQHDDQQRLDWGAAGYVSAGYFTNWGEYFSVRITAASVLSAFFYHQASMRGTFVRRLTIIVRAQVSNCLSTCQNLRISFPKHLPTSFMRSRTLTLHLERLRSLTSGQTSKIIASHTSMHAE